MSDKIRLSNPNKFAVGIVTLDKPLGINIAPGSFTMVTQDDIDYIMSTCSLLQRGVLRVADEVKKAEVAEQMGVDIENNANFMSDEDIKKKLNGTAKKLDEWLSGDVEPYVLDRIADLAVEMNLSLNKIKVLQDKIPDRDFTK